MIAELLRLAQEERAFMERAACLGMDTDLFFPRASRKKAKKAKAICAECEVAAECLEYALDNNELHGIWGGMELEERNEYRRIRERN